MMWLSIKGRHHKFIARLSVGLFLGFFIPAYILDSPEQLGQFGVNIIAATLLLAAISNSISVDSFTEPSGNLLSTSHYEFSYNQGIALPVSLTEPS
jgi:hypothetical protein